MPTLLVRDTRNPRRRERLVSPEGVAEIAGRRAAETGRACILVRHGGTVPNCYKGAAWTQCALAVALPDGRTALWAGEIPANKATLAGAAGSLLAPARGVFDQRYSPRSRRVSRVACIHAARAAFRSAAVSA